MKRRRACSKFTKSITWQGLKRHPLTPTIQRTTLWTEGKSRMKKYLIILTVLIAVGATAQPVWVGQDNGFKTDLRKRQKLIPGTVDMTGQIKGGRFVYSGIAVDAIQDGSPLELINPIEWKNQTPHEDNVARDLKGNITGLKLLSIHF